MAPLHPQYQQFLEAQGTGYAARGPLTQIPGHRLEMPGVPLASPARDAVPPGFHRMPDGALMADSAMGGGTTAPAGLPRQITRPRNADLFGRYVSTYEQGRAMGTPPPDATLGPLAAEEEPFFLSAPPSPQPPAAGAGGVDPRDAAMAANFPRAFALQQKLNQARAMQQAQASAAAMQPRIEADLARQKADMEIALLRQKGALEDEAMRRKLANTEAQMQQQARKAQLQRQLAPMAPQGMRSR